MALNINGRMKVKTLRADFKQEFGLTLRVYDGRSFADDHATLASIRKGDSKGGEFAPKRNTKVGNLEDKIMEMFGIKTQVAGSDDSYLCDNDLTLAGALEADEKKMAKKVKKTESKMESNDDTVISETRSTEETRELTEEEKTWLDDLYSLDEAPEAIRASKAFMLAAVKEYSFSLKYASEELKNNKEIVIEAVKNGGNALEYASEELKNNKEIAIEAAKNTGSALEYTSHALKNNKEIVLAAVKNYGSILKYASEELKNDKEIVIEAVENDGSALEYASEELQNDKEIVLEAIKNDGLALEYASNDLQEDKNIILEAVKNDSDAIGSAYLDIDLDLFDLAEDKFTMEVVSIYIKDLKKNYEDSTDFFWKVDDGEAEEQIGREYIDVFWDEVDK